MIIESMYAWAVTQDKTTDGQPCFVAHDLVIGNCLGQGLTPEEATANWLEAREELLWDN